MMLAMSGDRYIPRNFASDPEGFGKVQDLRWKRPKDVATDEQLASMMQHRWAYTIRKEIKRRGLTMTVFCKRTALSYQRFTSILRGSAVMRLDDIAAAHRHLELDTPEDLFD